MPVVLLLPPEDLHVDLRDANLTTVIRGELMKTVTGQSAPVVTAAAVAAQIPIGTLVRLVVEMPVRTRPQIDNSEEAWRPLKHTILLADSIAAVAMIETGLSDVVMTDHTTRTATLATGIETGIAETATVASIVSVAVTTVTKTDRRSMSMADETALEGENGTASAPAAIDRDLSTTVTTIKPDA